MSARTPAAPFFDQGLFLLHLNRGKEEMRRAQYDEARREFETAQRFRPNDPEVLSNLSFTLFHLGHYEEAERMTRSLLKSHADSVPLLFNLGLILFRDGRDAEAKEPLGRVLELLPGHRKAHLTLGLILQKTGETDRARRHFERAGAGVTAGEVGDDTVSSTARKAVSLETPRERPETVPVMPAESSTPLHPLVKPEAPEGFEAGKVEVRLAPKPAVPTPPIPASISFAPPPSGAGPFTPKAGGFLSADCHAGLLLRRGVVTGRSGTPLFEPDTRLRGSLEKLLVRAAGDGSVLLVDRGRRPHLLALSNEFLSVEPGRLLAFEESLACREDPAFEFRRHIAVPFLKLFGTGAVALSVVSEPARFDVGEDSPLTIAARAVLAYGGDAVPELLEENDPLAELGSGPVFRFVGTGYVLADAS